MSRISTIINTQTSYWLFFFNGFSFGYFRGRAISSSIWTLNPDGLRLKNQANNLKKYVWDFLWVFKSIKILLKWKFLRETHIICNPQF